MFGFDTVLCYKKNNLPYDEQVALLKEKIQNTDTILIGAGAGLSTAAGLTYGGERFQKYFADFEGKFSIKDMYTGSFYPFPSPEIYWAWWSRQIYFNRYIDAPSSVYPDILKLVQDKDYFVLTTNVDHQFQRSGFDKQRLFYTQGDYGLLQSVQPEVQKSYDNQEIVEKILAAQGFVKNAQGGYEVPASGKLKLTIPTDLIPKCPDDGRDMMVSVRSDHRFVEDEGWHKAQARYNEFLDAHEDGQILYLELGVGMNTPTIIKYPFWYYTEENPQAFYACINQDYAVCSQKIQGRSLCIEQDIAKVLKDLLAGKKA